MTINLNIEYLKGFFACYYMKKEKYAKIISVSIK